jgi:hypothetical protein
MLCRNLVNRVSLKDVKRNGEVNNFGEANTGWNYNTKESDNFLFKTTTKSLTLDI